MTTLQCIPREALKEYVSGWTDPEQSEAIESHLTDKMRRLRADGGSTRARSRNAD